MNGHDLGLLQSLDVLLEEGSVTRASQRLHVTQPALSAQLARLRKLLRDPLLVPAERGRGLRPTARAEGLRPRLHELLATAQQLIEAPYTFDPRTAQRDFTLAVNDNTAAVVGADLAARLRRYGNPGLRLVLRQYDHAEVMGAAARGKVDLVVTTAPFMPGGLHAEPLFADHFVVAQRKRHPRGTGALTLAEYCAYEHVLVSSVGDYRSAIDTLLARRGLQRRVAFSVQYYTLAPQLLLQTDCLATLPARFLGRHARGIDGFPLPFKYPKLEFLAGWHARFDDDLGHQWLRAQLRAVLAG